jgi:hypothetical protein
MEKLKAKKALLEALNKKLQDEKEEHEHEEESNRRASLAPPPITIPASRYGV